MRKGNTRAGTVKARILELAARGMSPTEIELCLGCKRGYAGTVLSRERSKAEEAGEVPLRVRVERHSRTPEEAARVRAMYAAGHGVDAIKRELRMGSTTVRRILDGWTPSGKAEPFKPYAADRDVKPAPDDDFSGLYGIRAYADNERAAAAPFIPKTVFAPVVAPGALGEAMS